MSWRQQPPVLSPVSPRSLVGGMGAALGLSAPSRDHLAEMLRSRYDARDALLTDSGTSALVLALRALIPAGGTVAFPGYACIDLTAAAVRGGCHVRLYDLDPATMSPDLDSLSRAIDRGVDAVVVVHLYGYAADVPGVKRLTQQRHVPLIEDAAQAAGGTLDGVRLGAFGDLTVLSFGRGKGTTSGSGGALLVRNESLLDRMGEMRAALGAMPRGGSEVVALAAQWVLARPFLYRLPASMPALRLGEMVYHAAGEPRAMPAAAAAILPTALALEERELRRRRANAKDLLALMSETPRLRPIRPISRANPGYLRLAFVDTKGDVAPFTALGAVRGYPLTLDQHSQLLPLLHIGERAGTGSITLRDRLFTVPTHSRVGERDTAMIANWLTGSPGGTDNSLQS